MCPQTRWQIQYSMERCFTKNVARFLPYKSNLVFWIRDTTPRKGKGKVDLRLELVGGVLDSWGVGIEEGYLKESHPGLSDIAIITNLKGEY